MEEEGNKSEVKPILRGEGGLFLPGTRGSPGRPKGKTIKERVIDWLEEHPDDMAAFVKHFVKENRELAWQMLEGRPQQDVMSGGKPLPTPIIEIHSKNALSEDDGNQENS